MDKDDELIFRHSGSVLRRFRLEAGLTMEEMSELIGISKGYYSDFELGRKKPHLKLLIRIARALKIRPGAILDAIYEEMKKG